MAKRTAKQKKIEKKIATALVAVLAVVLLGAAVQSIPAVREWLHNVLGISEKVAVVPDVGISSKTGVHFIDVGQGDAVLIEQDGEFALIDAGPPEGAEHLISYLHAVGAEKLRYMVMTHPHADHYGGMQAVVENFVVEQMILPSLEKAPTPTNTSFLNFLQVLLQREISTETIRQGAEYPLGSGKLLSLQAGLECDKYNLLSSIIMFEGGGLRYFSSGDAEKANEKAILKSGEKINAQLYKAAHHGSHTSNTESLLKKVNPSLAVVSCALNNNYGHPHNSVMENFENLGIKVLRTDLQGTVVVKVKEDGTLAFATEH